MTWFHGSLISLLSAKTPSVKTPLWVLYNQLTEPAARTCLPIHLLIHSLIKNLLYWTSFAFTYSQFTNGSWISLGKNHFPSFSVLVPQELQTPAYLLQGACIWSKIANQRVKSTWPQGLVQECACYSEKANHTQWDSILTRKVAFFLPTARTAN
jgi:hypothetical protein